ncbi:MAG TPA: glycosyltransferase family 4 protein [Nitrolancea sp.]|nr:glycosyltransferase family 4 protein [Nitrolancea sp.]
MRVLMAHNFYQQPGGEDASFAEDVELLRQHGHDVICYTRHNDEIDGMRSFSLAAATLWNRETGREIGELITCSRPDIVHLHNTFPLLSPSVARAARHAGVPVVQTLHNYRAICPKAQLFRDGHVCERCVGRTLAWPAIRHACYRGDRRATSVVVALNALQRTVPAWARAVGRFIVLTDDARARLIAGGLPAERLVVKPNFLLSDPGMGDGSGGYALFVGRLSPEKGVETLLDAWRMLQEPIPLKIAGDGPLANDVRRAADHDERISALGWCKSDQVLTLLKDAAFLVFPSLWYEGLPRVIIEAFAAGTPVVGSRLGAMRELVRHGETGLHARAGDATDLARQVAWLFKHPIERDRLRANARTEYETRYTAARNYDLTMAIYQSVLDVQDASTGGRVTMAK